MIDSILYIGDFISLVDYLDEHEPGLLLRNDDGSRVEPPIVTGIARTPAVSNGNQVMVYARLRAEESERWRYMPGVEILAEEAFNGFGTGDRVYQQIFSDPERLAKYDSVYNRDPIEVNGEDGGYVYTPPAKFGIIAGA
ncbi:hypothetical protein [Vreelandella sp. EE7]